MKEISKSEERKRFCLEKALEAYRYYYDEDISFRGVYKGILEVAEKFEEYLKK